MTTDISLQKEISLIKHLHFLLLLRFLRSSAFSTLYTTKEFFSLYEDYELFIKMGAKEDFSFLLFLRWEESEGKKLGCANHYRNTVSSCQSLNLHWQIFLFYLSVPFLPFTHIHREAQPKGKQVVYTRWAFRVRNFTRMKNLCFTDTFSSVLAHTRASSKRQESTSSGEAEDSTKGITRQFFHFPLKSHKANDTKPACLFLLTHIWRQFVNL